VNAIYLEGGGDSKEIQSRCREGFRKLLESCGFKGKMPRLFASGGREAAFGDFRTAHSDRSAEDYVAMLVDSEEPVADRGKPWAHLQRRDGWKKPAGAGDDQALLIVTCMETWVVADRTTLTQHYGNTLQVNALPALANLECRPRHELQDSLAHATRNCSNAYAKGKRSFEVLGKLQPSELEKHLPSFARVRRILRKKL
jgi:Domain of unknown function (DUF4276)